jgi:hypothetical protein
MGYGLENPEFWSDSWETYEIYLFFKPSRRERGHTHPATVYVPRAPAPAEQSSRSVKLNTNLHVVPVLGKSGAIPPLSSYARMASTGITSFEHGQHAADVYCFSVN